MDRPTGPVATTRIRGSTSPAIRVFVTAVAVVGLALVKPWSGAPASTSQAPIRAAPATSLAAAPTPLPSLGRDQIACDGARWQIVSLDRLGSWTARTWIPVRPVTATGPSDPTIPLVTLDGGGVLAVGACAGDPATAGAGASPPGAGEAGAGDRTPPVAIMAWRLAPAGTSTAARFPPSVVRLDPTTAAPADRRDVATLYRPSGADRWPPGRYVLRLTRVDALAAWVVVDVSGPAR